MDNDEVNQERLGKIVELARRGEGGERETAIKMVRRICEKYNLNFDAVMEGGEKIEEFRIACKESEETILSQVVFRYGLPKRECRVWGTRNSKSVVFEGTKSSYIEALNAWAVLQPLYKKEEKKVKEAMRQAFLSKHDLFYKFKPGEKKPKNTSKPMDAKTLKMAIGLISSLEDADIHKTLKQGK